MVPAKKLELIERKIQAKCQLCKGTGCGDCKAKSSRIKIYANANIPMDYWLLAFKDFKGDPEFKNQILEKLTNIDEMYELGTSLAFVGNFGVGKTYAASCILKTALMAGYSGRYIQMSEIVNNLVSSKSDNSEYLGDLVNIDFLVIDEFGKRSIFPSEKTEQLFGQTLEYVIRSRFQNHMPTILCSNTEDIDDVLSEDFSRAFSSLRSRYLKIIIVGGKDFRKSGV